MHVPKCFFRRLTEWHDALGFNNLISSIIVATSQPQFLKASNEEVSKYQFIILPIGVFTLNCQY